MIEASLHRRLRLMTYVLLRQARFQELQADLSAKDKRVAELGGELDATLREVRRKGQREEVGKGGRKRRGWAAVYSWESEQSPTAHHSSSMIPSFSFQSHCLADIHYLSLPSQHT